MRQAALSKDRRAHFPSSGAAREDGIHEAMTDAFLQAIRQTNIFGPQPNQTFGHSIQQTLPGAIDQAQSAFAVESKDSDLDFLHHFPEKGSRFECAEPLLAKRFSQSVHFASDIGERIGIAAVAAADGVVAFPERGEQICQGLKGEDNALSKFGYHSQPEA